MRDVMVILSKKLQCRWSNYFPYNYQGNTGSWRREREKDFPSVLLSFSIRTTSRQQHLHVSVSLDSSLTFIWITSKSSQSLESHCLWCPLPSKFLFMSLVYSCSRAFCCSCWWFIPPTDDDKVKIKIFSRFWLLMTINIRFGSFFLASLLGITREQMQYTL